jgi:hypothetical protein
MRKLLLVALAIASGCSGYKLARPAAPPIDAFGTPPGANAEVCVLRPHVLGAADLYVVRDNDQLVGATRGPSYFCYFAAPGRHLVTSEGDALIKTELLTATGHRYYVQQSITPAMNGAVSVALAWLDEATAVRLLAGLQYAQLVSVPRDEQLPGAKSIAHSLATR